MRIVKTQKILYNHELRIRLISEPDDAEYVRLIRKLPDCRWSIILNSWHTRNIPDHIPFLNGAFPEGIKFFDISIPSALPRFDEEIAGKRIFIYHDQTDD